MDAIELTILDSSSKEFALTFARRGDDVAVRKIPFDKDFDRLASFNQQIFDVLKGVGGVDRPQPDGIVDFGRKLFAFVFKDDLKVLYDRLPETHVSIKILSTEPRLRQLAWEFLQEPNRLCPRAGRCVVRVIPTIGRQALEPIPKDKVTKVLFVAADPVGLKGVSWDDVRESLERVYGARLGSLNLDLIEGTDRDSLVDALLSRKFDIVHFSCHGDVVKGKGRLILINRATKRPDYITSEELGVVLSNRGIRLVILSACSTSAGNVDDDFASIAETLVRQGIQAVVANQAPVLNKTVAVFVGALYRELLDTGNIDKAVTSGRIALKLALRDDLEWGIPTLHRLHGAAQLYA